MTRRLNDDLFRRAAPMCLTSSLGLTDAISVADPPPEVPGRSLNGWPTSRALAHGGRGDVGNAGGAGVLAADAAQRAGLEVPELSAGLQATLRASVPAAAVANPVDLGAAAGPEELATALQAMTTSGEVDAVIAVFGVTAV